MKKGKFATAINCIDGRTQIPVIEFSKNKYDVTYIDMVTEAGPNRILADNKDKDAIGSIKKRVKLSIDKHQSKLVAIVGHYDCAGNPVDDLTQYLHLKTALKRIQRWNLKVKIIGLWVNGNWRVTAI